jgi:hypothetical protein
MKVFATFLAVALGLWVCSAASAAAQDLRNPDQVAPAPATQQDLRNPDQIAPAHVTHQDLRNPDRVAPEPALVTAPNTAPAPSVASTDAIPAPDAGLSTLLIVLISTGTAVAVAGAAYTTMRIAHAHGRAAV